MHKVLDQYAKHIIRIRQKAHAMKSQLTHGERKAIAYYTAAANAVQRLIEASDPEWVGIKAEKWNRL
jgi:hypothetical protein